MLYRLLYAAMRNYYYYLLYYAVRLLVSYNLYDTCKPRTETNLSYEGWILLKKVGLKCIQLR
jgi:hypothetical protein